MEVSRHLPDGVSLTEAQWTDMLGTDSMVRRRLKVIFKDHRSNIGSHARDAITVSQIFDPVDLFDFQKNPPQIALAAVQELEDPQDWHEHAGNSSIIIPLNLAEITMVQNSKLFGALLF